MQLQPTYRALTDRGRRRERNEDYVDAGLVYRERDTGRSWHLLTVADGVGGHQRGDWASQLAVSTLKQEIGARLGGADPGEALRQAFQAANDALWQEASVDPTRGRAATTLVAVVVDGEQLWWANVGDSRAYLVRAGQAKRLTEDHSWVQEQVRLGLLTPEQAETSTNRNVITRGIGFKSEVEVDIGKPIALADGDVLILSSDGLHGLVKDTEIAEAVGLLGPDQAAEHLVALSNERGGPDNISVIVCAFSEPAARREIPPAQPARGPAKSAPRAPVTANSGPSPEVPARAADSAVDVDEPATAFWVVPPDSASPASRPLPTPGVPPAAGAPEAMEMPATGRRDLDEPATAMGVAPTAPDPVPPASAPPASVRGAPAASTPRSPAPAPATGRSRPSNQPPWLQIALVALPVALLIALAIVIAIQFGLMPMGLIQ